MLRLNSSSTLHTSLSPPMEQDTTQTMEQLKSLDVIFNHLVSALALIGYDCAKLLRTVDHTYSVVENNRDTITIGLDNLSKLFSDRSMNQIGQLEIIDFYSQIEELIKSSGLPALLAPTDLGSGDLVVTDWNAYENDTAWSDTSIQTDLVGVSPLRPTLSSSNSHRIRAKRARRAKEAKKARDANKQKLPFTLSRKQDLMDDDVRLLANHLVNSNVEEFLEKRLLIQDAWRSALNMTFDTVELLSRDKRNRRENILKMRFGYASMNDKIKGFSRQDVIEGYLDDVSASSVEMSKARLMQHIRIADRVSRLAGPTPFLLCIFCNSTETIMYVVITPYLLLPVLIP